MGFQDPDFATIDHTADLGIIVHGVSVEDLFESAAGALTRLMVRGLSREATLPYSLKVEGVDPADLMVRFLGEILYLLEGEQQVLKWICVDSVSSSHLHVTGGTVPFDSHGMEVLREIKAVTYHGCSVVQRQGHWEARIIFDL